MSLSIAFRASSSGDFSLTVSAVSHVLIWSLVALALRSGAGEMRQGYIPEALELLDFFLKFGFIFVLEKEEERRGWFRREEDGRSGRGVEPCGLVYWRSGISAICLRILLYLHLPTGDMRRGTGGIIGGYATHRYLF